MLDLLFGMLDLITEASAFYSTDGTQYPMEFVARNRRVRVRPHRQREFNRFQNVAELFGKSELVIEFEHDSY